MAFPNFPYTDFHRLNADWILKTVRACAQKVKEAAETVETYADRLLQVETDVTLLEGTVTTMNGTLTTTTEKANGAVRFDVSQSLNNTQKTQARTNIGALSSADIPDMSDVVRTTAQTLTEAQKTQARTNIGASQAGSIPAGAVRYDAAQTLTNEQKTQARSNIGASQAGTVPAGAVRYDAAQTLTVAQKAQARENIGVSSGGGASDDYVFTVSENEQGTGYDVIGNLTDAAQVTGRVFIVLEQVGHTREALADMSYTGATLNSVSASFADFFAVDSTIPNTITEVIITSSGATVTDILQRQVPQPSVLGADAGKALVAGRGACSWERITPIVNTVSGTTPTVTPADNNIYNCGELTSLTISSPPASGAYAIVFTSGATATVTTGFSAILGLESFTPAANTIYEINVLDNRAVIGSWAVNGQ